jgi:hypothetical protein
MQNLVYGVLMQQIENPIDVNQLDLDPLNPRLPEEVQKSSQAKILTYLYENDVLEELIDSYLSNGYFAVEPMLVLPLGEDGRRIVVEGNRRLGALMILLQLPPAGEADISRTQEYPPPREVLDSLTYIPAVEVASREELSDYLGFRHISGLKVWAPEAKARWLYLQVEAAKAAGSTDPFYEVGRRVGSNSRGVRSAYNAYNILRRGREIVPRESDVEFVMKERFGVWTRLLGTANVQGYIGMTKSPITYEEAQEQVEQIDPEKFAEVISDLVPPSAKDKAVLEDSRDATDYSTVLGNERAHETLRTYRNLRLAKEVAELGDIKNRLRSLVASIESLTLDVGKYKITQIDADVAGEVFTAARSLRAAVDAAVYGDE